MLVSGFAFAQNENMLNESFEAQLFPPQGWKRTIVSSSGAVSRGTTSSSSAWTAYDGSYFAAMYYTHDTLGPTNRYLITPKLAPVAGDSIIFYMRTESPFIANDTKTVEISTTGNNAADFTTVLHTITQADFPNDGSAGWLWYRFAFDLSDYAGQKIYIAFHDQQQGGGGMFIDKVSGVHLDIPTITQFPYEESFEAGGLGDWRSVLVSGIYHWYNSQNVNVPAAYGTKYLYFPFVSGSSARLVSPILDLTGIDNPYLKYVYFNRVYNDNYSTMEVYYRTSPTSEWISLASHTDNGDNTTWGTYILELPAASSTYQVMFQGNGLGLGNSQYMDLISVYDSIAPECDLPLALAASEVTSNSATVAWIAGGAETSWKLQYKLASDTVWGEEITVEGTPSYQLTGLAPTTQYNVRVSAVCSETSVSTPVQTTFMTECGVYTLPFFESFENYAGNGEFLCWQNQTITEGSWGLTNFDAFDGVISAYFTYEADNSAYLISPTIDNTSAENPYLRYDYYSREWYGDYDSMGVYYRTSPTAEWIYLTSHIDNGGNEEWGTYAVALPETSATLQIAFLGEGMDANSQLLDNIHVFDSIIPDCQVVSALTVSDITASSATVTWTAGGTETSWKLQYKTASDSVWSAEITIEETPSYQFTGLTSGENYQVRVSAVCSETEISSPTQKAFSTPCYVAALPFSDSFENYTDNGGFVCWTNQALSTGSSWYLSDSYSTDGMLSAYFPYLPGRSAYLISPVINTTAAGNVYLKYDYFSYEYEGTYDTMGVYYRTSPSAEWTYLASHTDNGGNGQFGTYAVAIPETSETLQIAFLGEGMDANNQFLDNIHVFDSIIPDCQVVSALTVSDVMPTSANVTWTAGGTETAWKLQYKLASDTVWSAEITVEETPSYQLAGLTGNEQYVVRVFAVCSETSVSAPVQATFATPCTAISVATTPWTENFESYGEGAVPDCWTVMSTYNYTSTSYNAVLPSVNTQHQYSNTLAMWVSTSTNNLAAIALPQFVENLNTLRLKFGAKIYNAGGATLQVGYVPSVDSDLSEFQEVSSLPASDYAANWNDSIYNEVLVDFNSLADGTTGVIVLRLQGGAAFSQWHLDNFEVSLIPEGCLEPTNLATANVTGSSADLTWNGTADTYTLYYKAEGEGNYTPVANVTLTNGVYALTGLAPRTLYSWYVEANCSETETSEASVVRSFMTECADVVAEFPYTESFEDGDLACWTNVIVTGEKSWSNYQFSTIPASDGTKYLYFPYTEDASARLESPVFDLTSLENPVLSYDLRMGVYQGATDSLEVYYRASADAEWTFITYHVDNGGVNTFHTYKIELQNPSATYQVMFLGIGRDGNNIYLDNISVYDSVTPECVVPTNLAVYGQTQTSANVTWAAGGNETSWKLQYKLASENGWVNPEITVSTTPNHTITGLTAATEYEVRVKAVCGTGNESDWTESVAFTTLNEDQEPCNVPTNLTVTDFGKNSITITWDANGASKWAAQYRKQGVSEWTMGSDNITVATYTFSGLEEATIYEYQVQAVCDGTTSAWSQTGSHSTGIDSRLMNSVSLYPNPATNHVDVLVSDNDVTVSRLEVYDVYGKLLNEVEVVDNPTRIDVSSLASGVYFVKVITGEGVATKTFVKK